jgi:hypothetical protein
MMNVEYCWPQVLGLHFERITSSFALPYIIEYGYFNDNKFTERL